MKFVDMVENGKSADALDYAITNLAPLTSSDMNEFEAFNGSLMWAGKLHESPYADLLDPIHLKKLSDECWWMLFDFAGQPKRDHLCTVVTAGMEAIMTLLKLADLAAAEGEDWQTMDKFEHRLPLRMCRRYDRSYLQVDQVPYLYSEAYHV